MTERERERERKGSRVGDWFHFYMVVYIKDVKRPLYSYPLLVVEFAHRLLLRGENLLVPFSLLFRAEHHSLLRFLLVIIVVPSATNSESNRLAHRATRTISFVSISKRGAQKKRKKKEGLGRKQTQRMKQNNPIPTHAAMRPPWPRPDLSAPSILRPNVSVMICAER